MAVGGEVQLFSNGNPQAETAPSIAVANAGEDVGREGELDGLAAQIDNRDSQLSHGIAEVVLAVGHRDASLGCQLPAVPFPLATQGQLGMKTARLLPAVVAHQEASMGLVVGVKPAITDLTAGPPEPSEIAVRCGVRVDDPATPFLPKRGIDADVAQDQACGLTQLQAAGIAAIGAGAEPHHRAQARVTLQDVRSVADSCYGAGLPQLGFAGEHGQLIGLVGLFAQDVGGAAHPQHLAAETGSLGPIDQHCALGEAKALLTELDLAVASQEAKGPAVKQKFGSAVARAQLLPFARCLVDLRLALVDVNLPALDNASDGGALERCRLDSRDHKRQDGAEPHRLHGGLPSPTRSHDPWLLRNLLEASPECCCRHGRFQPRTPAAALAP